ncbi:chitodextrinase [Catenulispora sp. GP43]|uniref:galactose-binding domain-containing protein n=1 Tax=Catenulispora sp. GP43 TaxID=3156263 RepID=UPI0035146C60
MTVTRRRFLTTAAAGSAAALIAGPELLAAPAARAASPAGDVVGKITVGYQGWFACAGDGAPINGWWHWSQNWSQTPSPSNNVIKAWPDMREYTHTYQTAYANLGNGQPATLFSSYDQQTVDTHFLWMQQNGCDTAALQRFNPNSSEGPTRDAMATKVRSSAETYGRKFYIMYDVTGWTSMQTEIKADWTAKMSALTASSAYARQNGKPVVGVWGFGFNDANHPWDAPTCLDVITWFKSQGCYVMGGVPREWRTGTGGSRPGYIGVYHAFDMLSPWMVGAIGTAADSDNAYTTLTVPDLADCTANNVDYQPCVLPGDVSGRQRVHGDFMWRQFYNMARAGTQSIYISMFDEYGEGNQIAKTAENQSMSPTGSGLLALDEDGTACSSDYYLRLTADGGRMLKGQLALTATRPTQPVLSSGGGSGNLALGKPTSASGNAQGYVSANAVDGDPNTYWESVDSAFPQWFQVDLGSATAVASVVMKLPSSWGARTQTLTLAGSTDGSTFNTLAGSAGYTFDPASGNSVTVTFGTASVRYLRATFTANTGWPAGQLSEFQVYAPSGSGGGDTTPPSAPTNLTVTGHTSTSVSLSWTASTDNVGVTGYQVKLNGATALTTAATSATVTGLSPSRSYSFAVVATDAAGNLSQPSATVSATTDPAANANLALGKATSESGHTQGYASSNAVDGDPNSYWESIDNAFPQWLMVDLGAATPVSRIVLKLPPATAWAARTQTLSVTGGADASAASTLVGSAGYGFDPATGNAVTITFPTASVRYVRLTFTANTGWPAGQISEFEVYAS